MAGDRQLTTSGYSAITASMRAASALLLQRSRGEEYFRVNFGMWHWCLHERKIVAIGTPSELKALAPLAGTIVVGFRGVKWQALQPELGKVAVSGEIRAAPRVGFEL